MKNLQLGPSLKVADNDTDHFLEFLQEHINHLCWLIAQPETRLFHPNFLRVAIVTKHALIDFARILKGRRSTREQFYRGGPVERDNVLLNELKKELVCSGLAAGRKVMVETPKAGCFLRVVHTTRERKEQRP